jgi:hypothetical protein
MRVNWGAVILVLLVALGAASAFCVNAITQIPLWSLLIVFSLHSSDESDRSLSHLAEGVVVGAVIASFGWVVGMTARMMI